LRRVVSRSCRLEAAERHLCVEALGLAGNIVGVAQPLGITSHASPSRSRACKEIRLSMIKAPVL